MATNPRTAVAWAWEERQGEHGKATSLLGCQALSRGAAESVREGEWAWMVLHVGALVRHPNLQ